MGWAVALSTGVPLLALMASPGATPHSVLVGVPLLITVVGGALYAVGALDRAEPRSGNTPWPNLFGPAFEGEPFWMQPRSTLLVAASLLIAVTLVGGAAHLPVAFVLALLAIVPSAIRRPGLLVLTVVGLIYLPMLGTYSLWDPWETQYGAVAREIVERDDWISLWYGPHGWHFSKPVFLFWNEALWLNALGIDTSPGANPAHVEWALRLPVVAQSLAAVGVAYLTLRRIYSQRAGALAALVMATCPQFFFLAHQAMTDMYLVANLVMAVCMLALAFATDPDEAVGDVRLFGFAVSARHLLLGGIMALVLPQALYLVSRNVTFIPWEGLEWQADRFLHGSAGNEGMAGSLEHGIREPAIGAAAGHPFPESWDARLAWLASWLAQPITQGIFWLFGLGTVVRHLRHERRARALAMTGFYVFCALAFLSKGILGVALPGAVALLYLTVSRRWKLLLDGQLRVAFGISVGLCVAMPWHLAMFVRHGEEFIARLLLHDHLRRFARGVQGQRGSIDYYIEQLGFGTYPWIGLLPAAVVAWLWLRREDGTRLPTPTPSSPLDRARYHRRETMILLGLWFFSAFALFSAAITKFHHYILPAVPPAALMVGLLVDRLWGDERSSEAGLRLLGPTVLALAGPTALVAGVGGLVGDLRGVAPESIGGSAGSDWVLEHPMSPWLAHSLIISGSTALAIAAAWLWRLPARDGQPALRRSGLALTAVVGAASILAALVGWELSSSPFAHPWGMERLMHLFCYAYDRPWPAWLDYRPILTGFAVTAVFTFLLATARYARPVAARALLGVALLFSAWSVNVYLVDLSPHRAVGQVVTTYYEVREGPEEALIAWQMNWKGEIFYTGGRVHLFVDRDDEMREWIAEHDGRTTFAVLERKRLGVLRAVLRGLSVEEVTDERVSNEFVLVRILAERDDS